MATTEAEASTDVSTYKLIHTMLRVKDPKRSISFYENFGLTKINEMDVGHAVLHYIAFDATGALHSGRHWTDRSGVIELTYERASENDPDYRITNGNTAPYKGFCHVAISVDNVAALRKKLEKTGMVFEKSPTDDSPHDVIFTKDPDCYLVGITGDGQQNAETESVDVLRCRLNYTMFRIKDPRISLKFYQEVLGMELWRTSVNPSAESTTFHLIFPGDGKPTGDDTAREGIVKLMWKHGTEDQSGLLYHSGNSDPKGFGHVCISVDDLNAACARFESMNTSWAKRLSDGSINDMAFILDPDGYWIEILQNEKIKPRCYW